MDHLSVVRRRQPQNILVVEDDPGLGRLVQMVLSRFAERVSLVHSGGEAIAAVDHGDFEAIACDISLPDMSGLEVIAQMRRREPGSGIVAVTGMVDVTVAVDSMKAGADDFLGKPFDPEILWHMLNKAADSRARHIEAEQAVAYRQLAYTDALTGAPNRRFIDEFLVDAIDRASRDGQPLSVAYLDIDNFKLLNDFVGHDAGDEILCAVANALHDVVVEPAAYARFGGDEFVVVFPGICEEQAEHLIESIRRIASRIEMSNDSLVSLPTRLSCGIATFTGSESPRALVSEAEDQMYLDKSLTPTISGLPFASQPADALMKVKNIKALRNLVKAIDRRDSYTRYHSDHATRLAVTLGRDIGLPEESMTALTIGGPIHDLGKIVVPDEILRKPGRLSNEERKTMEEHPVMGAAITAAVTDYDPVVNLVRHHHERWDGDGYPGNLKQDEIWVPTRLFTLCDAYSAMTTDRPYRKGLTPEQALAEIERGRGTQFDPDLGLAFINMVQSEFSENANTGEAAA